IRLTNINGDVVHFWAPTFKWGLSIANVADFSKPPDKLSYPQQIVVAFSGIIWSRYGTVITPRNWNLIGVNMAMSGTGFYQLSRKIRQVHYQLLLSPFSNFHIDYIHNTQCTLCTYVNGSLMKFSGMTISNRVKRPIPFLPKNNAS
ncbi:hypothetical protein KSS87_020432, partial [Heliosperma pusillum]